MATKDKPVAIRMEAGCSLENINIVAERDSNLIAVELASGASLINVGVENAAIGAYGREIADASISNFTYKGDGQAFDITGERATIAGSRIHSLPRDANRSTVGYTKPNGPPLPAQCPNCKSIFPSKHYNVAIPHFLVRDNLETCPVCREPNATLAEGLFALVGEFARVIEAEQAALSMLKSIGAIASDVVNGSSDVDEAIRKIELISPKAADVLRRPLAQKAMAALFLFFLSIATLNQAAEFNENYRPAQFVTAIYTTMSQYTVKAVSEVEYSNKQKQGQEGPAVANPRSDRMRKHCNHNSTSIPSNIPVPIPRPIRPKGDR